MSPASLVRRRVCLARSTPAHFPRSLVALLLGLLLGLVASACSSGPLEPALESEVESDDLEILLSATSLELTSGDTFRIYASARTGNGAAPVVPPEIQWTSSDTVVATVSESGLVFARDPGTATITASKGNSKRSAKAKVRGRNKDREPSGVVVSPGEATLGAIGRSLQFQATVLDQNGDPIEDPVVTWSSLNPEIATVDGTGMALSKAVGVALITAVSGGFADTAQVTVSQVVASVAVSPKTATVAAGDTVRIVATAVDSAGTPVSGVTFDWSSSDGGIATVGKAGLVKGVAAGSVKITAAHDAEGKTVSADADVTVTAKEEDPDPDPDPDPGPSTTIHPGDDIQAKIDAHPAGTRFLIKAGVHRMHALRPKDGQEFVGEPGAVLSGAKLLTEWTRSGGLWTARAEVVESPSSRSCTSGYDRCTYQEDLFLDDGMLHHVASLAEVSSGKWHFDHGAGKVYMADDPRGRTVEIGQTRRGFRGSARGVVIRGLTIEKYSTREQVGAIHGNSTSDWVVEDNVIRQNHGVGIRIGDRMVVRNNRILANGQLGIGGIGDDVLVEGNEIAYNNAAGYKPGWEAGGSKFVKTRNLVVRGNHVHDNNGKGLWTDIDNIYTLYEDNLVEDNRNEGIFHEISYDAVIRHNTVRRNGGTSSWLYGAGILVAHSPNVEVYGNLVEDNRNGIAGIQQHRSGGTRKLRNLHVHNNTIRMTQGQTGVARDDGDNEVFAGSNRFESNTYIVNSLTSRRWHWRSPANQTWAEWQESGQDQDGSARTGP